MCEELQRLQTVVPHGPSGSELWVHDYEDAPGPPQVQGKTNVGRSSDYQIWILPIRSSIIALVDNVLLFRNVLLKDVWIKERRGRG